MPHSQQQMAFQGPYGQDFFGLGGGSGFGPAHHGPHSGGPHHRGNGGQRHGGWGVQKKQHARGNRGHRGGQRGFNSAPQDSAGPSTSYAPTPRSVPRAPLHDAFTGPPQPSPALHGSGFHMLTPAQGADGYWKNSYSTVDKETADLSALAGINMYGSNALLIGRAGSDDEDEGGFDDDEDQDGQATDFELNANFDSSIGPVARAKLEEQAAYIAELEEERLNLKERIYLLEQQLREKAAQDARLNVPAGHSTDGSHDEEDEGRGLEEGHSEHAPVE